MKLEKINGVDTVIMADNESLHVTTEGNRNKYLKVNNDLKTELVDNEDFLCKCDEWLDYFKKIHDIMFELVSNKDFANNELSMYLYIYSEEFPTTYLNDMYLILANESTHEKYSEGIRQTTHNNNIFNYLLANVINYIMQQGYIESMQEDKEKYHRWSRWFVKSDNDRVNPPIIIVLNEKKTRHLSKIITEVSDSYKNNTSTDAIINRYRQPLVGGKMGDISLLSNLESAEFRYNQLLKMKEENIGQQRKRTPEHKD